MDNIVRVEKVSIDDFEKVYPLLLDFNNTRITKSQWKNLFIDYWNFQPEYCGYKLVHGDEVVGFIAYIISRKIVNGKEENFCNISSWIVKMEYRSNSIDLLYPLLDMKDYTIISFTPTPGAYKVEKTLFKLKILDRFEVIIPALPVLSAVWKKKIKVITHPMELSQYLLAHEKKIFQDHSKFDCKHLIITSNRGNLYLIFRKTFKRHMPFAKLYFVSNLELFLHYLDEIRFRVPLTLKTVGIVVDSRFLENKRISFSKNKTFYMPMLYRSDHLLPHEVDYLYSEFFLLGV